MQCSAVVALLPGLGAQRTSSALGGDNCSFGKEPWCAGHAQVAELPSEVLSLELAGSIISTVEVLNTACLGQHQAVFNEE